MPFCTAARPLPAASFECRSRGGRWFSPAGVDEGYIDGVQKSDVHDTDVVQRNNEKRADGERERSEEEISEMR
jgi:hypothetical protein